jgi:transposase
MPKQRRIALPRVLDVLRLHSDSGLSERAIARSLSLSHGTVGNILSRAKEAGLSWPLPANLDERKLEALLFPKAMGRPKNRTEPDWNHLLQESKKKGVTLQLLWMEYKTIHPEGYQYSQFCERFNQWKKKLQLSLRQEHKAGEKLFIDYAGPTIPVIDAETGEIREAQLFVATLGASNYTYAEAQWGQDLQSFVGGHVRALQFFGGAPELLVPDNLKSGVKHPDRYEPVANRTYHEMASHYGIAVLPARPRKPKDKAKVEAAVLLAERWILAVLRNRRFFSLAELNAAIRELLDRLNEKPFQKMEGSRKSWFENLDKPALRPLPRKPYEFAVWRLARVNIDYHIALEDVLYSVPFTLVREEVDVRMTESIVEVFHKGKRVASHRRAHRKGHMVTDPLHRPKSHQKHMEWTPSRLIEWGSSLGPSIGKLVEEILARRPHPEQGYRSCLGILSLSKRYPKERVESAAARAIAIGAFSYTSLKSILEKGLEQLEFPLFVPETPTPAHENVRGAAYYQENRSSKLLH